jgi:hypothetical protein
MCWCDLDMFSSLCSRQSNNPAKIWSTWRNPGSANRCHENFTGPIQPRQTWFPSISPYLSLSFACSLAYCAYSMYRGYKPCQLSIHNSKTDTCSRYILSHLSPPVRCSLVLCTQLCSFCPSSSSRTVWWLVEPHYIIPFLLTKPSKVTTQFIFQHINLCTTSAHNYRRNTNDSRLEPRNKTRDERPGWLLKKYYYLP